MPQRRKKWSRIKSTLEAMFDHRIDNPKSQKRSLLYAKWFDVGFLRVAWTNEGQVVDGLLRSNNPTQARYEDYAARGIRTVLNLRNDTHLAPPKLSQFACKQLGMTYVSFPMAPRRAPTRQELLDLITLFPTLEKPILMHCKSGADRTGLASVIWLLTQENTSLNDAREELGVKYLHLRDFETGVLDAVFDCFEGAPTGMLFEQWVRELYDPEVAKSRVVKPQRSRWENVRIIISNLYKYAQHREAHWHKSFEKPIETDADQRRADRFIKWVDHGVLRRFWTNRAVVAPGVIRSNHPTVSRFYDEAANGVRTVINLRGASMEPQYILEKNICAKLGLNLIDIPLSATRAPTPEVLVRLLDALNSAERPLLMHCKSGADRTGLASAIFILDQGGSMAQARAQLSPRFLHFKSGRKGILDSFIGSYEREGLANGMTVRSWIETGYLG